MAQKQTKPTADEKKSAERETWIPADPQPISMVAAETPSRVRVRKVIEVVALRGKGTKDDPARTVQQYYDLKGRLLAERELAQPMKLTIRFQPDPVSLEDVLPNAVHGSLSYTTKD